MKISEIYKQSGTRLSFEIFPPKGDLEPEHFVSTLDALSVLSPDFISVTCSAGGSGGSIDKTVSLAAAVQEKGISSSAHLTCIHASKDDVKRAASLMRESRVENVLALRGDLVEGQKQADFSHASELIAALKDTGLCIGAACYPEGHVECDDTAQDMIHLKEKQEAGADFFISQLFFENDIFYRFLDRAQKIGVTKPIAAGIMPFLSKAQITRMIFSCGASLPASIIRLLVRFENDPDALRAAGIRYATEQILDLLAHGHRFIHVYTMNKPDIAESIVRSVRKAGYIK